MELRPATMADERKIEELTREAFWDVYRPGCNEHVVIHKLRGKQTFIKELEYVAVEGEKIIGHIAYSRLLCGMPQQMSDEVIGFGPISVHPDYQKQGIGKQLISFTEEKAAKLGYKAILITGSTHYYHALGYQSASKFGIYLKGMSQEDEAAFFMAKEFEKGYLEQHQGIYDFDEAFNVEDKELEEFEKHFPYREKREPRQGDL